MSMTVLFVLLGIGLAGWWLFARQLTARPWEAMQRTFDDAQDGTALAAAPARVGLWILMAVITSFFGLFISAYGMRMMLADWQPLSDPLLLWVNTLLLALSSLAFQWTRHNAKLGDPGRVKTGLAAAGFFAFAFLAGQWLAWGQLADSGQYVSSNAATAFFYLLTALHGVHLLGGLAVWCRTTARMWRGDSPLGAIRLSVELCTVYWHYLLLVWLALFGLLLTT